jgi:hypothetical protein
MDAQFLMRRERPLLIAGPPGTRTRLDQSLEVFFPRSSTNKWRFSWKVMEIEVARPTEVLGHCVTTTEVLHYSGAPVGVGLNSCSTNFLAGVGFSVRLEKMKPAVKL